VRSPTADVRPATSKAPAALPIPPDEQESRVERVLAQAGPLGVVLTADVTTVPTVTDQPLLPLEPDRRMLDWRLAASVLGLVGFVAAILLAYFALPPDRLDPASAAQALVLVGLAIGLLVLLYARGLRRVSGAARPVMRVLSMLIVFFVVLVVLFSYVYLSMEARRPGQIPGLDTHIDALYFTVTMLTTVGFGDISPAGQTARAVATGQMVFNLVFLGAAVTAAVHVGQEERQRRLRDGIDVGGG